MLPESGEFRYVERVPYRHVLQTDERSILDPARRVDLRLVDADTVGQGRRNEVLAPFRIAFRRVYERGVVEDVESLLGIDQEAQVEPAEVCPTVETKSEARICVTNDY